MTNIIHSPMKLSCFSCVTSVFMYVMTLITFCMFSNLVLSSFTLKSFDPNSLNVTYVNQKLSLMCLRHIKIGYFCLLSSIILKNISVVHATHKYHTLKLGSSKLACILSQLLLFLLIINFLLIGIVDPGILNPGPSSLKICYQNVQGLIPIKDLALKQPSLNITKICYYRTHLDNLSFVSNIASTTTSIANLNKSFFFRSHTLWNSLPFDIRNSMRLSQFKIKLAKHLWSIALSDNEQPEHEWSFQSSDEGG